MYLWNNNRQWTEAAKDELNFPIQISVQSHHQNQTLHHYTADRLRVVSNFGDGDCGAGEIHTRARAKFRGDAIFGAPFASRRLEISRARVCVYFARPTIAMAKIRDYSQST